MSLLMSHNIDTSVKCSYSWWHNGISDTKHEKQTIQTNVRLFPASHIIKNEHTVLDYYLRQICTSDEK